MMTKSSNEINLTELELQRLKNVLDIYGAQSERWPENEQGKLLKYISGNKHAKSIYLEAKALDELLSSISDFEVPDNLNRRIVASVSDPDQVQGTAPEYLQDNVVRLTSYQRESQEFGGRKHIFATTALMAASLLIGIFIGYSELSLLSGVGSTETEIAIFVNSEQSDISSPLTQQSLEESLSFTEESYE